MNSNADPAQGRKIPDFLTRERDFGKHEVKKPKRRKWHIVIALLAIAAVLAAAFTYLVHPLEARSGAIVKPEMTLADITSIAAQEETRLWSKGADETPPFLPVQTFTLLPPGTTAKPDPIAVAKAPAKSHGTRQTSARPAVAPNPCGSMQYCATVLAKDSRAGNVLRACRNVLDGGGGASSRTICDAIFASIQPPYESGISDDERKKAAVVCHGMKNCERIVTAHPSAVVIVDACKQALNGSSASAPVCDKQLMAMLPST